MPLTPWSGGIESAGGREYEDEKAEPMGIEYLVQEVRGRDTVERADFPQRLSSRNTVARARWARGTLFHEAEHAAYILRKSGALLPQSGVQGRPFARGR